MNQKAPKNITSIIFDLGGVLFDIEYARTQKAFIALGAADFDKLYSQHKQEGFFDDFEKGKISNDWFRSEVRRFLPEQLHDKEIDAAWNALLIGFPDNKVELITKLKKHYRVFLLSNTNNIHLPAVLEMMDKAHGKGIMSQLFEKEYYSCLMGMRKPDAEIFSTVCSENGLNMADTIFVDDTIANVEGAQRVGLHTLHYTPAVSMEEYFL